jgi:hypothetical protein
LSLQFSNLLLDVQDVVESLLVIDFSLLEGARLNLNLFVQQLQLFVSLDKLSAQDVSLVDDHFVVLPLLLLLRLSFTDDILKSSDISFLGFNHFLRTDNVSLDLFLVVFEHLVLAHESFLLLFLLDDHLLLVCDFFLAVRDLLSHSSEVLSELSDFILGIDQVLGVEISV